MITGMFGKRLSVIFTVAFFGVATAACGSSDSGSSSDRSWPSEVKDNFLTSCEVNAEMAGASSSFSSSYCKCVLQKLEDTMTADEFAEAEQKMMRGQDSGVDLESLAAQCA